MPIQLDFHDNSSKSAQYLPLPVRRQNLILSAIAMLSDKEIQLMDRENLLFALQAARTTSLDTKFDNIGGMNVLELRRLLAIVRNHFRDQMHDPSKKGQWHPEFN